MTGFAGRLCTILSGALFAAHLALPAYRITRIVVRMDGMDREGPTGRSLIGLAASRPEVLILVLPPMAVVLLLFGGVLFPRIVTKLGIPVSMLSGLAAFACWGIALFGMIFVVGGGLMGFQPFGFGSLVASATLLTFGFLGIQAWRIAGEQAARRPEIRFLVCLALFVLMCCPAWEWFVVVEFRSPSPIVTPWFGVGVAAWAGLLVGLRRMVRESGAGI